MNLPTLSLHTVRHALCLTVFGLLLFPFRTAAQTFKAEIEEQGGYYRLMFTVSSRHVDKFTPPSLAAFDVLSGPNTSTSSSFQFINGKSSSSESTTFTYILSAKKSGKVTIGPASVLVKGKKVRSNSVTLNAREGSNPNGSYGQTGAGVQGGHDVQQAGTPVSGRDLFIDVTPSRTKVREQEAVLLTYRVHSRVGVGLSNTSLVSKPDFKGIISQEIPIPGNQIQTSLEQRNGTTYKTGTILQYVIFPQQSGKLTIPSITFDCTVIQQDHTMDLAEAFFNGGGTIGVAVKREVPALTIDVEKLPEPRPAGFSGAVGKFDIQGKVLSPTVRTNEVITYRITLNGLGNMKLITAPAVAFPKDFDTYDAKTTDNSEVTAQGLKGQLTFDYTFVPRNVGKYTIPAVEFVYFDTESGAYRTIRTAPVTLHVGKGAQSNDDVNRQLAMLKSDIRPLKTAASSSPLPDWGTGSFLTLCLALLLFLVLAHWLAGRLRGGKNRERKSSPRGIKKQTLRKLQDIERAGCPTEDFYPAFNRIIGEYVVKAFGIPQAELKTEYVRERLSRLNVREEQAELLLRVIDAGQYGQYAPQTAEDRDSLLRDAVEAVEEIDLPKRKGKTTMRPFALLIALHLSLSLSAAAAPPTMADGERAYYQKDYAGATRIYESLLALPEVKNDPRQAAAAYYNLGNCYYRTKEYGKAVLNFQRALRLNPSDTDAAFNLELTQSKITDRFDSRSEMFFFTWWRNASFSLTATAWGYWGIALFLLCFVLWQCYRFGSRRLLRGTALTAASLCLIAALCCFLLARYQSAYYDHRDQAVIMQEAQTFTNPTPTAPKGKTLHEGTTVLIKAKADGDWWQIELPDGSETWIVGSKDVIVPC